MSDKRKDRQQQSQRPATIQSTSKDEVQKDKHARPDRTGEQNRADDEKRNDEKQYHAGGAAHDPRNKTQQRVDSGDPDAGDVDEETRSEDAPFNKTYGHHE